MWVFGGGVRERFEIQKHKNGDGMILNIRLATFRKEEGWDTVCDVEK